MVYQPQESLLVSISIAPVSACRLCNSLFAQSWISKDAKSAEKLPMALCQTCGLVQQVNLPTDEELSIYYSNNYREDYKGTHKPKLKYVHRAGKTAKERLGFIERAGINSSRNRLLDIGAGGGEFCYTAEKAGFLAQGIEPHRGYSEFARDEYGVDIRTDEIAELENEQADVVTMFHVFEHLAHPTSVMRKVWEVLSLQGHLVIEVPNIHQANTSPHNIYFKAHLFYYSRFSLMAAASQFFELVHVEDKGNLLMAFRKRAVPLHDIVMPSSAQIKFTQTRLRQKGWGEYLFAGGGLLKPVARIKRIIDESCLNRSRPKDILDQVWMSSRS